MNAESDETRATIIAIGSFDEQGHPVGWVFDCNNSSVAAIDLDDPIRFAGYTADELREIQGEESE